MSFVDRGIGEIPIFLGTKSYHPMKKKVPMSDKCGEKGRGNL